jgi:hypothetical protein
MQNLTYRNNTFCRGDNIEQNNTDLQQFNQQENIIIKFTKVRRKTMMM